MLRYTPNNQSNPRKRRAVQSPAMPSSLSFGSAAANARGFQLSLSPSVRLSSSVGEPPSVRDILASSGVNEPTSGDKEPPLRFGFLPSSILTETPSTKVAGLIHGEDILLQDPDAAKPSGWNMYLYLLQNPVSSKIFTMGLVNIKTDLDSLKNKQQNFTADCQTWRQTKSELNTRLTYEERARDLAFEEYEAACTKYNNRANKVTLTKAEIQKGDEEFEASDALKDVTDVFVDTLSIIMAKKEAGEPGYLSDGDIDEICALLEASTYEEIFKKTIAQCLAILHVLDVLEYKQHPFCVGLWNLPLNGMSRQEWRLTYGLVPGIITGTSSRDNLRHRVADLLGRVPTLPPPGPPVDNVESETKVPASIKNRVVESLTDSEVLEILNKRVTNASTTGSDDGNDAATAGATAETTTEA